MDLYCLIFLDDTVFSTSKIAPLGKYRLKLNINSISNCYADLFLVYVYV